MVDAFLQCDRLSDSAFNRYSKLVEFIWSSFLKLLILVYLAISFNLIFILTAQASTCQNLDNRTVCIITLKRSAKYYWEYRAVISVDGQKKPLEIYNCRDRFKTNRYGDIVPFSNDGISQLVCSLYAK